MYLLVHPNSRVNIKDDTRIRMTTEEAEEWKNGISKSTIYLLTVVYDRKGFLPFGRN